MADLRSRFLEDYAGGLLNVARQELSSTGEVLAQDGFLDDQTLFVEDGRGVKSALRLGSGLAEVTDPTTETGVVNIRTADRTYAKIRDLKLFTTAVASAQGALSDSVAETFTNFEGAFQTLESDIQIFKDRINTSLEETNSRTDTLQGNIESIASDLSNLDNTLTTRIVLNDGRGVWIKSETYGSPSSIAHKIGIGLPLNEDTVSFSGLRLGSTSGKVATSIENKIDLESPSSEKLVTEKAIADIINALSFPQAPIGSIVMWSNSTAPDNWQICDGSPVRDGPMRGQLTPDLRGRFPIGVGDGFGIGGTGGSRDAIVVEHSHTGSTAPSGEHFHNIPIYPGSLEPAADNNTGGGTNQPTTAAGVHTHTFTTDETGESGTDKNLPPYYGLVFIMRIL